ncbi:MAG: hypothetical protein ACP5UO_04965 [Thermoplasmata archaeon]
MGPDLGNQPYPYGVYGGGRKRGRTGIGVLLIAIGLILGVIPTVGDFLSFLILVGLVLVVLGSSEISKLHRRMSTISLVIFIAALGLMLASVLRYYTLLSIIASGTSLTYSIIVKYTDPFLFFISLAYVIMDASLFLAIYNVFSKKRRIVLWAFYVVTFLVVSLGIYSSMSTLNRLYYQPVTLSNVGVFTSVASSLDGVVALFLILWAIAYFLAYFDIRKASRPPLPGINIPGSAMGNAPTQNAGYDFQQSPVAPIQPEGSRQTGETWSQQGPQVPSVNQPGTPPSPSPSSTAGQEETILFTHAGAVLTSIDGKRVSIPPHSGSLIITDRRFMFLSKGRGGVAVTGLLGGSLTYGLLSRATTKVDLDEINDVLRNPGSFWAELGRIREVSASPSTVWHTGKLSIDFYDQVNPNETNAFGNRVLFTFMGRGSPGGTILKKEEVNYLNNNLNTIIRTQR